MFYYSRLFCNTRYTPGLLRKEGIFVVVVCHLRSYIQQTQTHDPERKQTEDPFP